MNRYLLCMLLVLAIPVSACDDEQQQTRKELEKQQAVALKRLDEAQREANDALDAAIDAL